MAKQSKEAHYSVGRTNQKEVFREIKTGQSISRVMSKRVYDAATARAGEKMREYAQEKKR